MNTRSPLLYSLAVVVLAANHVAAQPANDRFANRTVINGTSVRVTGSNVGATTESGESTTIDGAPALSSVWWSWTAPTNGLVRMNTSGTTFHTLLAVYTGTSIGALNLVAENFYSEFSPSGYVVSQVIFEVQAGTEYQIQVAGIRFSGSGALPPSTGTVQLNLDMLPTVTLTAPADGSIVLAGDDLQVTAEAHSPNGTVSRVDFYQNAAWVGTCTNAPYQLVIANPPLATNHLYAVVTDTTSEVTTSAVVRVLVAAPGLTVTWPVDGAEFLRTDPITVNAFARLTSGAMTNVEFHVDGEKFGEDPEGPFSAVWSGVTPGTHRLLAIGWDDAGNRYVSAPAWIAVAQTLVATGSVWKYLDNGSDQGTGWREPHFDDGAWMAGPAELGYGDDQDTPPRPEATVVSYGPDPLNKYITTYFRSSFVAANVSNYGSFVFRVLRDDGAVVYVNGEEAARLNMPEGPITYRTLAYDANDNTGSGQEYFPVAIAPSLVLEGTNTLAVEIHQSSTDSSDLSFDLELLGLPVIIRNVMPTVHFTQVTNHQFFFVPAHLTLDVEATDADGSITNLALFWGETKLAESAQSPCPFAWSNVPPGIYRLTAVATDNEGAQTAKTAQIAVYERAPKWVAYNDHYAGPATHPNATAWNAFGTLDGAPGEEGMLQDVATGAALPAFLSVFALGASGEPTAGAPRPGTPAADTFGGYVDFGSGDAKHAILLGRDSVVFHWFSGLDPNRRYQFRGTAMGGVPGSSNRWTLVTLLGAQDHLATHSVNVLTAAQQPGWIYPGEAALNTGDNSTGDVVGWDDIVPGPDGTFAVVSTQYLGPAPGNVPAGLWAYALTAVRLEETATAPFVELTRPRTSEFHDFTDLEIAANASAVDSITNVLFLAGETVLGADATPPYSLVWSNAAFGEHELTAIAFDSLGASATSAVVYVIIRPPPINVDTPTIVAVHPPNGASLTNLTSIEVTFSELVFGVDAGDLLMNGVPATGVSGSGSNYVFAVRQPAPGNIRITWAPLHGITDRGYPASFPFDHQGATARWNYWLADRVPPTVIAQDPPLGVGITNFSQVTFVFSEPVVGVDPADLLVRNTPATAVFGSGTTYTFTFPLQPYGVAMVRWSPNHGVTDCAIPPNAFQAAPMSWTQVINAMALLVPTNSAWRVCPGTSEASTPPEAWREPGFDEVAWAGLALPVFYGEPYDTLDNPGTLLGDMMGYYSSVFLRKEFNLSQAIGVTNLLLKAQSDDGFVAWINGTEVLRYNVPLGGLPFDGTASSEILENGANGVPTIAHPLPDPAGYVREGLNVLAIQAFNWHATNDDFTFDAQLYAHRYNPTLVGPGVIRVQPASGFVFALTNLTVRFNEPVAGVEAEDLLVNGLPAVAVAGGTSNEVFTFDFPQPAYGAVAITWRANHGIADFDQPSRPFNATASGSTWQYILLDPQAPTVAAQAPPASATVTELTHIAVTFSESVTGVDASDLLINGLAASDVSGSGNTYTFGFTQPVYGAVNVTWSVTHGIADAESPPTPFNAASPGGTWSYLLLDQTPPAVAAQAPPTDQVVTNLTAITVTFTETVRGVNAADLRINGQPATSVSGEGAVYTFGFPKPNASVVRITWAENHGIWDLALPANNRFDPAAPGALWTYTARDDVAPAVVSLNPPIGLKVRSLTQLSLVFDESVTGLEAGDLLVNGLPAAQMEGVGAGPYVFSFAEPPPGPVEVAWAAGHGIQDLAEPANAFEGPPWTYVVDPKAITHVIHLVIDGLGAVYLEDYLSQSPERFPNFRRLQTEGAWTLNARCDYDASTTLPNHAGIFTGRPVLQPDGWPETSHHGITFDMDNGGTMHDSGNPEVPYQASVFDVVHDHGLSTAFLYSKQSITFFVRSWTIGGGPDLLGADNGANKVDYVRLTPSSPPLVDELVERIATNGLWNYTFVHFVEPDSVGHSWGWGSTTWSNAVQQLDGEVGRILDALTANPLLRDQCRFILTADHGGGVPYTSHNVITSPVNYTVPLFLWGAGIPANTDLYGLMANRADPGMTRPSYTEPGVLQPLRNGDSGNLALALLDLPPIPGSSLVPLLGTAPVTLTIATALDGITVAWPANAEEYELQACAGLSVVPQWQTVTNGIAVTGAVKTYCFQPTATGRCCFFRLQKR